MTRVEDSRKVRAAAVKVVAVELVTLLALYALQQAFTP